MTFIQETNRIPVKGSYDVLVAGGGVAGVAGALAAARQGRGVLLLEKSAMLGGLATLGLINLFVPLCNGRGRVIIKGLCEELLRLSIRDGYDTIPEQWQGGEPGPGATQRYVTRFSPSIFALTLTEALRIQGVDILFDTVVAKPVMEGPICKGLIVENKGGRQFYGAGVVIDATGDADVLYRAGVPTVQGKNFFTYSAQATDLAHMKTALDTGRVEKAFYAAPGGRATLYGEHHPEGMKLYEGTTGEEVSEYLILNQLELLHSLDPKDRETRDLITLPGMAQLRTTRHIVGDHTLTMDDCYRHFDDSISAICDFDNRDRLFEVPLRCLTRKDTPNLLTAGRSAAATGYAWDVLRVIPPAIVTGQAAGLCAAQALEEGTGVAGVRLSTLQSRLEAQNVMLRFDDAWVPTDNRPVERAETEGHI